MGDATLIVAGDIKKDEVLKKITELFGPIIGLKEEWASQGATAGELDMSVYTYRDHVSGSIPVSTGWIGGPPARITEETDAVVVVVTVKSSRR